MIQRTEDRFGLKPEYVVADSAYGSADNLARDVARAIATTPEYELSRHRRKKVEMLFAHLKRILRMARLRLRGPCGARDEFLLAATAQNLRRLAKLRPLRPPQGAIAACTTNRAC